MALVQGKVDGKCTDESPELVQLAMLIATKFPSSVELFSFNIQVVGALPSATVTVLTPVPTVYHQPMGADDAVGE
jgi:hypothetical protein